MIKAFLEYQFNSDDLILAVTNNELGKRYILQPTKFIEFDPYKEKPEPTLKPMEGVEVRTVVQAILDAAWEQGLRPTGFKDIKNETTAIKEHLRDMRRLVFSTHAPYNVRELD